MACSHHPINVKLDKNYHIANIGISKTVPEIFYTPLSLSAEYGLDLNYGQIGGTVDHFSFHKDGRVHIKFKSRNRDTKNRYKMPLRQPMGSFVRGIPSQPNAVRHLLIDCFYRLDGKWLLKSSLGDEYMWFLGELRYFSLILVLMHNSVHGSGILHCDGITQLKVYEKYLEIPMYADVWKVVVYATPQALKPISLQSTSLCHNNFILKNERYFNRSIVPCPQPLTYEQLIL